jgi:hypothetical protein
MLFAGAVEFKTSFSFNSITGSLALNVDRQFLKASGES